jgi:hypothetical protein
MYWKYGLNQAGMLYDINFRGRLAKFSAWRVDRRWSHRDSHGNLWGGKTQSGEILVDNRPVTIRIPRMRSSWHGYPPDDRKLQGLFLKMAVC